MDRIEKLKSISTIAADPSADIALINQYSVKELAPRDVFCFSIILCDNEVDRDMERFTDESLEKFVPLFLGKSVLFDHRWSTEKQVARLYRTFLETTKEKTLTGQQKKVLRGSAYMLKTEENEDLIKAIEGGIKKEVSVGCQVSGCNCSICGKGFRYQWETGKSICEDGHIKGDTYDEKLCVGDLVNPKDAYEVSFVAVPAQRGAGVTKASENEADLLETFKNSDLSKIKAEDKKEIISALQMSLSEDDEKKERTKILSENEKYLGGII